MAVYRSRLAGGVVGAGLPAAQRSSGSRDPVSDARNASITQEPAEAEQARQRDLSEKIEALKRKVLSFCAEGLISPPTPGESAEDWVDSMSVAELEEAASKAEASLESSIEDNADADLMPRWGISADDPMYEPIRDADRRKLIEGGLKPLDLGSLLFHGYLEQAVQTRPGLEITLRTISTQQSLWLETLLDDVRDMNAQYGRHWYSLLQVACGLHAINGKEFGQSLTQYRRQAQKEDWKKELMSRMEKLGSLPGLLTDDFIVQFVWFSGRVRRMLVAGDVQEKLGNS